MDCRETQSKIINFIDDQLDEEETLEFINHIRNCKECFEELEINYIMLVGMRQLDDGEELTADFQKRLKDELGDRYDEIIRKKNKRRLARLGLLFFFLSIMIGLLFYFSFSIFSEI
ncbi:MAG: zf-HC2 domain-containing protein [Eubacterium sp.]|nr:zf-HC2 domain-containing protein [Eubacterium sp.]MDD7208726.1 zf-HC2 domain-containing protein [Lachnospiraceae bacterium]MDY5497753.1 zf-HC2 domain-containing protein [Anaerobutyricum sp.]